MKKLMVMALVACGAANAQAEKANDEATCSVPGLQKKMAYKDAREFIVDAGFQPDQRGYEDHMCILPRIGVVAEYTCEDWPEALACTSTGMGPCMFTWIDEDQNRLLVATQLDDYVVVGTEYDCRGWNSEPLR